MVVRAFDRDAVRTVTRICRAGSNNAALQRYQAVYHLEGRTGRVCAAYRPVNQRLVWIVKKLVVPHSTCASHKFVRIIGRTRHHRKNLACGRLDGDDGACFSCHEILAVCLKVSVETEDDIFSRHRQGVVLTVHETLFLAVVHVDDSDFYTFLTAKIFLVIFLNA